MNENKKNNRLIHETSPYLLQHAHNPVDWFAWGPEALEKAKKEGKPILLSVGYSACHWCHVMAHESFENESIAALMNELYVCIKVDREERPDLDNIYQKAVQMLGRNGGWPLTVFLTPSGQPFWGGTYFPPVDRYGMPGFPTILQNIAHYYTEKREDIDSNVTAIQNGFDKLVAPPNADEGLVPSADGVKKNLTESLDSRMIERAVHKISNGYDPIHGGFGSAPKFPSTMTLELFLRYYHTSKDKNVLDMVTHTLKKMARGGIYDQIGGGFSRYSTDSEWLVPHFEKMLYDNTLLIPLYLECYQITNEEFYAEVVRETLAYILRDMTSPEGGFYSAEDADSEGEEGKFYLWHRTEVTEVLTNSDEIKNVADSFSLRPDRMVNVFCDSFDITEHGNWFDQSRPDAEPRNILHVRKDIDVIASVNQLTIEQVERIHDAGKKVLLAVRAKRTRPGLDDKILTGWNALAISAFAKAYQVLGDPVYRKAAETATQLILNKLIKNKTLNHTYKNGIAKGNGYIDDYTFFVNALLDLYDVNSNFDILQQAIDLTDRMNEEFWDPKRGGYWFTGKSHEELITRVKEVWDQSIPSGQSLAVLNQLRLYHITENTDYLSRVEQVFWIYKDQMEGNPYGFGQLLCALHFYQQKPIEIVVMGKNTKEFVDRINEEFIPNRILHVIEPEKKIPSFAGSLLQGKKMIGDKTTVYICRNFICSPPATEWKEVEPLIQ